MSPSLCKHTAPNPPPWWRWTALLLALLLALPAFVACDDDHNQSTQDLADTTEVAPDLADTELTQPDLLDVHVPDLTDVIPDIPDLSDALDLIPDTADIPPYDLQDLPDLPPDLTDTLPDHGDVVTTPTTAEEWARALIAGEVTTPEAFHAINWLTGFPVRTASGTIIFIHWYQGGQWTVAGDFSGWMQQDLHHQNDFWWAELSIANGEGQKYKFVNNGNQWVADPWSRAYGYDNNGEFSFVERPTTAHLQRWQALQAEGLAARVMRAYVPAGDGPWPVLYMHDGQNLFDPNAMWGGWRMQEALANLGKDILIIGIDNTADRMHEYTHVDDEISGTLYDARGDAYARLLELHVRPYVESTFPTNGLRGLMGSSLGGLISLYIAHLYPQSYHFVASLSGTLGWGKFALDNLIMQQLYENAGHRDFVIYVDSGGGPGTEGCVDVDGDGYIDGKSPDNYCHNVAFAQAMDAIGYTFLADLFHWWEENAEHNEAAWASRVFRPLGVFADMSPP